MAALYASLDVLCKAPELLASLLRSSLSHDYLRPNRELHNGVQCC